MLAWPSFLCQIQHSSFVAYKHFTLFANKSSRSTIYIFSYLWPTNMIFYSSLTIHLDDSNITIYHLSHSWLILSKLCFNPLTSYTFSIIVKWALPTFSAPIILPMALSPKVTKPPSFDSSLRKLFGSLVMCLEHPLSKNHFELHWDFGFSYKHFKHLFLVPKLSCIQLD